MSESPLLAHADKFCPHCGDEMLPCCYCGEVIKKNGGWHVWMDFDGTGPVAGQYHGKCLEAAKACRDPPA